MDSQKENIGLDIFTTYSNIKMSSFNKIIILALTVVIGVFVFLWIGEKRAKQEIEDTYTKEANRLKETLELEKENLITQYQIEIENFKKENYNLTKRSNNLSKIIREYEKDPDFNDFELVQRARFISNYKYIQSQNQDTDN